MEETSIIYSEEHQKTTLSLIRQCGNRLFCGFVNKSPISLSDSNSRQPSSISMSLICLSYSHHHTPIQFREQVYFDANSAANACVAFVVVSRSLGRSSNCHPFYL